MSDELEIRVANPVLDISLGTSEEVIGDGDTMSLEHEPIDEVRADEPGAASHQDALLVVKREELHFWVGLSPPLQVPNAFTKLFYLAFQSRHCLVVLTFRRCILLGAGYLE